MPNIMLPFSVVKILNITSNLQYAPNSLEIFHIVRTSTDYSISTELVSNLFTKIKNQDNQLKLLLERLLNLLIISKQSLARSYFVFYDFRYYHITW